MNKQLINTENMIEIRRYLHQHPELSFKNRKHQIYCDFYKDKD